MIHSVANHLSLSFNDVHLELDVPKFVIDNEISESDIRPSSLDSLSISSGSIPDILGVPSLDSDGNDASLEDLLDFHILRDSPRYSPQAREELNKSRCQGRHRLKRKARNDKEIEFVDCGADHPLILGPIEPAKPTVSRERPYQTYNVVTVPPLVAREQSVTPVEMATYSEDIRLLVQSYSPRCFRPNPAFLRMYIAEREMVKNNKLNGFCRSPFLSPRADPSVRSRPVNILGMPCRWPTYRRTRRWEALTPEDVDKIS